MSPRIGADLDTILRAAAEIADTRGMEEVTLASVAQKLNIRSPSLYNHVDGLPGLRRKLAVYGLEQLHVRLQSAVNGQAGDEAIRKLAWAYVQFSRTNPGLYSATLRAPDPEDPELLKEGERLVNLVLEALAPYGLEPVQAIHAVRGLRSIIHGFSSLERIGGFGMPVDLDRSLGLLLDVFLAGIGEYRK